MINILNMSKYIFKIGLILAGFIVISFGNSIADSNANEEISVALSWTAPGDDGRIGTAVEYDVRYSTSPISLGNWDDAIQVETVPSPDSAGSDEQLIVTGLDEEIDYYFAVRTRDEVYNWSGISNIVYLEGAPSVEGDDISPDPITDLTGFTGYNSGEILISWSATGDDGSTSIADYYQIRYSLSAINENTWNSDSIYSSSPDPEAYGEPMSTLLSGLTPGETYYIAVKARDEANNWSAISNVVSAEARYSIVLETDDTTLILDSPSPGSVLTTPRPVLTVQNVDSSPSNLYYFMLADDSGFVNMIAIDTVTQGSGGLTSWTVPTGLADNVTYYWKVTASNGEFSIISNFTISLPEDTHAFPNPFNFGNPEHEDITFTGIPENGNLIIMTISGQTVKIWSNISGGSVQWNGLNESNNEVSSGTYLWFIEGSDTNGKLVVLH